jgi:diacylglycerol kinase (ATP)
MSDPSSILISANPRSGASSGLELTKALALALDRSGWQSEWFTDPNAMARRAGQLRAEGRLRTVVAAGGDGTASLVLSLIPQGVPLTLFPIGSENLLAKFFGIARDIDQAVRCIRDCETVPLDLFYANQRLTLLVSSVGFDAEVVRQVHSRRQSHVDRWQYRWAILRTMATYTWPRLRVSTRNPSGEWEERGLCNWVFAFNVPKYAANLAIIEDGACDDGQLEIGMFRGGKLCRGLWHYLQVARRAHHRSPDWSRLRASAVRIEVDACARKAGTDEVSYQVDGDWGGLLPLEITPGEHQARIVVDRNLRQHGRLPFTPNVERSDVLDFEDG